MEVELKIRGIKLDAKDFSFRLLRAGTSDPYLVFFDVNKDVELGRSNIVEKNCNPDWEPVKLKIPEGDYDLLNYRILIECWDKDKRKWDDLIGTCKVPLGSLTIPGAIFVLTSELDKPAGKLAIDEATLPMENVQALASAQKHDLTVHAALSMKRKGVTVRIDNNSNSTRSCLLLSTRHNMPLQLPNKPHTASIRIRTTLMFTNMQDLEVNQDTKYFKEGGEPHHWEVDCEIGTTDLGVLYNYSGDDGGDSWMFNCKYSCKASPRDPTETTAVKNPTTFIDDEFPPEGSSVCQPEEDLNVAIECWMPARHCGGNDKSPTLFKSIDPMEFVQGALGNCWLIAAIATLKAEHIKKVFVTKTLSERGRYEISLFDAVESEWVKVVIDEMIPFVQRGLEYQPCFAKPVGDEFWMLMLEKAFAKFCGSYAALNGGQMSFAFRALTGETEMWWYQKQQPGQWSLGKLSDEKEHNLKRSPREGAFRQVVGKTAIEANALWDELEAHHKNTHILSCSSHKQQNTSAHGILPAHAYSFFKAREETLDRGGSLRLVQLRNPHGDDKVWTGPWGNKSSEWTTNPRLRERLGQRDASEGTFWMSFDDFAEHFTSILVVCCGHGNRGGFEEEVELGEVMGMPDEIVG